MKILIKFLMILMITPFFFIGCSQNDEDTVDIRVDSVSPDGALAGETLLLKEAD